jgi:phosphoribosylamine---glycine ligase
MNVLVVGSGGREHTLVWKLFQSPRVEKIYCCPGNGGIASIAECVDIAADDIPALVDFAKQNDIGLTVVGPEDPLSKGIVDRFTEAGLRTFGTSGKATQLESSKIFAKKMMQKCGIPTASFEIFDNADNALKYLEKAKFPLVVKADGLAAGKGVAVCADIEQARTAVVENLEQNRFGDASQSIIIEDCLVGEETSILAFSDGKTVLPMVSSQDHKPAFDGDTGPNTGGMGAYSPAPVCTREIYDEVYCNVLVPIVEGMAKEGIEFKGVLYAGIMISEGEINVLEFNTRFGDPETQVLLPRIENDLVDVFEAVIDEKLDSVELKWKPGAAVCVVMASGGYPGSYEKGIAIQGLDSAAEDEDVIVFHAGTALDDDRIVTSGGRVLGVTATADTVAKAIEKSYRAVKKIKFEGAHFRNDIGQKALDRFCANTK